jgi:hypothetical protein
MYKYIAIFKFWLLKIFNKHDFNTLKIEDNIFVIYNHKKNVGIITPTTHLAKTVIKCEW